LSQLGDAIGSNEKAMNILDILQSTQQHPHQQIHLAQNVSIYEVEK
jgi:hypothetical protein